MVAPSMNEGSPKGPQTLICTDGGDWAGEGSSLGETKAMKMPKHKKSSSPFFLGG
jgi:hypothetical protein